MDSPGADQRKVPFSRRLGLDGLRGILAMLVVFFHLKMPFFIQGYSGVDGFFVLSGFVITSIIIREIFQKKELNFYHFYARRSKRLLPASLAVIILSCIAYRLVVSDYLIARNGGSFIAASTFWENFYLISNAKDYFGPNTQESPLMHYWSLAVEEQFYIVYPAILYIILTYMKFDIKKIVGMMCAAIGALLIYQFYFTDNLLESDIYFGTQFRIYQLLSGAVIGLVLFQYQLIQQEGRRKLPISPQVTKIAGSVLSGVGLCATILLATPYYRANSSFIGLLSTICTIMLIVGMEVNENSIANGILCHPIFQFLGKHSYSIYLWHYPFIIIAKLTEFRNVQGQFTSEMEVLIFIIVLSYLTWIFIELPIKEIKIPDKQIVFCSILAIVITFIAVSSIISLPEENEEPFINPLLESDLLVPSSGSVPVGEIDHVISSSSGPILPIVATNETEYYFHGDSFSSEMRTVVPLLAERHNIKFLLNSLMDCPWMGGSFVFFERIGRGEPDPFYGPEKPTDCSGLQKKWKFMFKTSNPKVIFLVTFSVLKHYIRLPDHSKLYPGDPGWAEEIENQIRLAVEPEWAKNPNIQFVCIETHYVQSYDLFDCGNHHGLKTACPALPAEWWPFQDVFISIYHKLHGEYGDKFQVITFNDIVCPDDMCSLMEEVPTGVERIFHDEVHLEPNFWVRHIDEVNQRISPFLNK